ncbi:F-actin-capping protein subunit alpha [Naganishia albida]|nr:F-actin-capping protein subunit alpha [Naganishia albida]
MSAERLRLAATLIEQSPPGQVSDVLRDLRVILEDESDAVQQYLLDHLRNYNLEHLQTICLPGTNEQSILCKAAVLPQPGLGPAQERYVDPRAKQSFLFDHVTHEMTDIEGYIIPAEDEALRSALQSSLEAYLKDHFASSNSACAVFSSTPPDVPVSAVSTIASEDAEEEEKAVRELDNASEVQSEETPEAVTAEEKETSQEPTATETRATPTSTAESTTLESADNSKTPDVEVTPGNSLVEAMTQTMASVVTAVEETVLGERPADESTKTAEAEDVSDSTGSVQQKPVPAEATETAEGKENDTVDSLQTQTIPEIVEPGKTDSDVQSESAPLPNPTYTMAIVGNKYNTQNFWTGQWRSLYTVDPKVGSIEGKIQVDVHYFENGNVQLAAKEDVSLSVEANANNLPSAIITAIAKNEQAYQLKLNATYDDLGEKNFRSLRRALPITRQRVEWEKIAAYKAGGGQLSK